MTRADVLRIAAESGTDARTVLSYISGMTVRPQTAEAIELAIHKLGITWSGIVRGETSIGAGPATKRGE